MSYFETARELDEYRDEPPQLATGSPGKDSLLRLRFERRDERSELVFVDRRAPLIVQRALYWDEAMPWLPCVFVITNSGGILQGDRYRVEIELGPGAQAHVTTQAAAKIHEMDSNFAGQTQHIRLAEGAYLEYLPDPMIPHKHSRFITRTDVTLAADAALLYAEILMPGRKYYQDGELFEFDLFSSLVRGERCDGSELFVEKFIVEPRMRDVRRTGIMEAYDVFGNVLLLAPSDVAQRVLKAVPAVVDRDEAWAAGASRLPNDAGLVYKILGMETDVVRRKVREFWAIVRREVVGCELPREFAWR